MKKLISLLVLVSALGTLQNCYSQSPGLRVGPLFGFGQSQFEPYGRFDQQPKLGFSGGIAATDQVFRFFGLETDFLLVNNGSVINGVRQDGSDLLGNPLFYKYHDSYNLFYAQIPFLLKASIGLGNVHLKVFGGPAFNYTLYASERRTYDDTGYDASNGFKRTPPDIAVTVLDAIYGFGFDVESPEGSLFTVELRADQGITPLGRIEDKVAYNNYVGLHLGMFLK
jgi:hypothetical protein